MGAAPSTNKISYTSPSFQLGGAHIGNIPSNMLRCLYNIAYNDALYFSSIFNKCGLLLIVNSNCHTIYPIKIVLSFKMFTFLYTI